MPVAQKDDTEIIKRLDTIITRLDVIVNLLLDTLPEEKFIKPRKLVDKVRRLDSTGIELRPVDVGNMLGRPPKDISSRRREYKAVDANKVKRERKTSRQQSSAIAQAEGDRNE